MRAFRVIRLFGRLGSLRDIITALTAAIIPVICAEADGHSIIYIFVTDC